jgi:hypothetical protein
MQTQSLIKLCQTGELTAKIVSTADSSRYMIGAESRNGQMYNLTDNHHHPVMFGSLEQARNHLTRYGVQDVELEINTAYDEMIGLG